MTVSDRVAAGPLIDLPPQPAGVPWPTGDWPTGEPPAPLAPLVDAAFDPAGPLATTYAVLVVQGGQLVVERYGGAVAQWDGPDRPVGPDVPLLSWSVAKSILHAAVGILVGEGRLDPDAPAPVPQWSDPSDPRRAITLEHLLTMRDGLKFFEDYVDVRTSDAIDMLYGAGQDDMAAFGAGRPLTAEPGSRFNYSSGTANILAGIVARQVGPGDGVRAFLAERLFGPIGARSATPTLDAAGTWVASSYVHATARDFARFGHLYLRDGMWDGRRILPAGWVDHGRRARSVDEEGLRYGALWWVAGDRHGTFAAQGYEGQHVAVCPAADAVVVRLGKTPAERYPDLRRWRAELLDTLAAG